MALVDDYIEREYGIKVTDKKPGLISSVGTTPTMVFRKNPNRIMWMIISLTSNTLYAGFDGQISTTRGILLDSGGGIAGSNIREDLFLTGEEVWIVADAASSNFYAFEVEGII